MSNTPLAPSEGGPSSRDKLNAAFASVDAVAASIVGFEGDLEGLGDRIQPYEAAVAFSPAPAFQVEDVEGGVIASFGEFIKTPNLDTSWPHHAMAFCDLEGNVAFAVSTDGAILLGEDAGAGGADYEAAEVAARSAAAAALSASRANDLVSADTALTWDYIWLLGYGQSLMAAQEAWPALTTSAQDGVLMLGQSTRPGGANTSTSGASLGDGALRPAVATVQSRTTGNLIDAAEQSGLPAGNDALGEDPCIAAAAMMRHLWLQHLAKSDLDRSFIVGNAAVSGRSIHQLLKGASPELFNRVRSLANAAKAAIPAGKTFGHGVTFLAQGEGDYVDGTDRETYKVRVRQLLADLMSDVGTAISEQDRQASVISYQTSAYWTSDTNHLAIGMAQLDLSREIEGFSIACPSYAFTDKVGHLGPNGSRWMGLFLGKAAFQQVILRRKWRPLEPTGATIRGRTVLVSFHVPRGPLQWRATPVENALVMFADKGFTVLDGSGAIAISDIRIEGPALVRITLSRAAVGDAEIRYAGKATFNGHGNLHDSDPTIAPFDYVYSAGSGQYASENVAELVGKPYPLQNACVAFSITATRD